MERKTIDSIFVKKYFPMVYQAAMNRLGDPALVKIACNRVFFKIQEAAESGELPAEAMLKTWIVFLTEDEAASMLKQASIITPAAIEPANTPAEKIAKELERTSAKAMDNLQEFLPDLMKKPKAPAAPARVPVAPAAAPVPSPTTKVDRPATPPAPKAAKAAEVPVPKAVAKPVAAPTPTPMPKAMPEKVAAIPVPTPPNVIERDTEVDFEPPKRPMRTFIIILISVLLLINLWFAFGLLCSRGVLPRIDLGYSWFDETFIRVFNL